MAAYSSQFGARLERRLRRKYPEIPENEIHKAVEETEGMLKTALLEVIAESLDVDTMIEAARKSPADQAIVESVIRRFYRIKMRKVKPEKSLKKKVSRMYEINRATFDLPPDEIPDFLVQDIIDHYDLPPLPYKLNQEFIDEAENRGLVMCHGRNHKSPRLPEVSDVNWIYGDKNPATAPDVIVDYDKDESLASLRYFQYVVNHTCPTARIGLFFLFLHRIRRIVVPGSHVYHLAAKFLIREIYTPLMEKSYLQSYEALSITLDVIKKLADYCGFRDMTIRTKMIPEGERENVDVKTMAKFGGAVIDIIC